MYPSLGVPHWRGPSSPPVPAALGLSGLPLCSEDQLTCCPDWLSGKGDHCQIIVRGAGRWGRTGLGEAPVFVGEHPLAVLAFVGLPVTAPAAQALGLELVAQARVEGGAHRAARVLLVSPQVQLRLEELVTHVTAECGLLCKRQGPGGEGGREQPRAPGLRGLRGGEPTPPSLFLLLLPPCPQHWPREWLRGRGDHGTRVHSTGNAGRPGPASGASRPERPVPGSGEEAGPGLCLCVRRKMTAL